VALTIVCIIFLGLLCLEVALAERDEIMVLAASNITWFTHDSQLFLDAEPVLENMEVVGRFS